MLKLDLRFESDILIQNLMPAPLFEKNMGWGHFITLLRHLQPLETGINWCNFESSCLTLDLSCSAVLGLVGSYGVSAFVDVN